MFSETGRNLKTNPNDIIYTPKGFIFKNYICFCICCLYCLCNFLENVKAKKKNYEKNIFDFVYLFFL